MKQDPRKPYNSKSSLRIGHRRAHEDLIKSLVDGDRVTTVLSIAVLETSKVGGYLIYECNYLDSAQEKTIRIIAKDITDAMKKLEPMVDSGIPPKTAEYVVGNELFVGRF
tara:strand:- start:46 stop:375 length:330 start_codon:yes stop_codon:yes gene_type:complete